MEKFKQTPGMTYKVITQDVQQGILEYTYHYPYCMRKSTVSSSVYPPDYERRDTGSFFNALVCSACIKTAAVRFWRTMKIN